MAIELGARLTGPDILNRTSALKMFWHKRDEKFKDWYEQIRMVDTLAQKDMESFVGNDPRASFNLVTTILNQRIPHRLPHDRLTSDQVGPAARLSTMFDVIWDNITTTYRQRGQYYQDQIVKNMLATGWYSIILIPSKMGDFFASEAWAPTTVYPRWSDVLSECAHIFCPGKAAIERMAARNGWVLRQDPTATTEVRDYWYIEHFGSRLIVHNATMVGMDMVKPDTIDMRFKRIPIFIFPLGGLPDLGDMAKRGFEDWKAEIGQSFIATNENVYKTVNKWWTFMIQILRDTAQAKTFEQTASPNQLVQPENWNRRGAHYKLGPSDTIGYIQPPAIPVELRSLQLDLEAMEQRGGPNWSMFGSVQQRMTAYAMAQIVATTNQMAKPYHTGMIDLFSDMDNFMYDLITEHGYKPYGMELPENLPQGVKMTASYELRIPGDLVQRATTARMLNPEFELSDEKIMDELFPEIKNPTEELARVRGSKARKNPVFGQLSLVDALRQESRLLRQGRNIEAADLYSKAADRIEQEITGADQQAPSGANIPGQPPVGI